MGKYYMKHLDFSRLGFDKDPIFMTHSYGGGRWVGRHVCMFGDNQHIVFDLNGPAGYVTGIYYGYIFTLLKDDYKAEKIDEWVEISPAHGAMYTIAQAQKGELAGKIKAYLDSIAQAVSDLELLLHDIRKYEEFREYLKRAESTDEKLRKDGELQLRIVFIDQVDRYAGGATPEGSGRFSMVFMRDKNIMPTIVEDFMRVTDTEKDFAKNGQFADLPEVEKRMLRSKWILYQDWKKLFKSTIGDRLKRLEPVRKSKERMIEEQREWIKPLVARLKLIEEGFSRAEVRKSRRTSFLRLAGTIVSENGMEFWLWKQYPIMEMFPVPGELLKKGEEEIKRTCKNEKWYPVDKWTENTLIFNKDHGLIIEYPWITEEWVESAIQQIKNDKWWLPEYWYYTLTNYKLDKSNIKYPTGAEDEDGVFEICNYMVSQNILFVKLLELLAEREKFEAYVNHLVGLDYEISGKPVVFWSKKKGKYVIDKVPLGEIMRYKYKVGEKVIGSADTSWPSEDKVEFNSKREMEEVWDPKIFNLKQYKGESKFTGFLKDLAYSMGLEFAIMRYPGPYERGFYERMSKYFLKPNGERFMMMCEIMKSVSGFGLPAH